MRKLLILTLTAVLILSMCSCKSTSGQDVKIFYMNNQQTNIVSEDATVKSNNKKDAAEEILKKMFSAPVNANYQSVFPKNTSVNSVSVDDAVVTVDFTTAIYDCDSVTSVLMRAAIVNSITSLNGVESVLITVNNEPYYDKNGDKIGFMNASDIVLDAHGETAVTKYVKLYFSSPDGLNLVPETREIVISDKETAEQLVVKELLKGPSNDKTTKTIPVEAKILSVETKEGICLVNFSQEFITKHSGGAAAEALTIYSVVNSLTELDGVDKVQFLIEGQKNESFIHMIFNEPFTRDDSYIQ